MVPIDYAIDQCVDNNAGYGDAQVAKKLEVAYRNAKELGFTHARYYLSGFNTVYSWMHASGGGYYKCKIGDYVGCNNDYTNILEAAKLWKQAARKSRPGHPPHNYSFENPQDFCAALDKLGAILGAISTREVLEYDRSHAVHVYKLTTKQARVKKNK